jgi:hypothetical protein
MAEVVYKSLTALQPLELRYEYFNDNILNIESLGYQEGYNFYKTSGFINFTDTSINKGSCFVLTTGTDLKSFFSEPEIKSIGELPGTFKLQARNSTVNFASYNSTSNTITFDSLEGDNFFITPVNSSINEIEIRLGNLYLQIDNVYPYTVRLGEKIIVEEEKYRQKFYYTFANGFIGFKVLTNEGFRFLSFGVDNILRAIGLTLSQSIINDYYFKCVNITSNSISYDFIPANKWVTYFLDFPNQVNNQDVSLNKEFTNDSVNFLIDFSIDQAIKTGKANINIANLKTGFTPAGGPAPVDNSYTETIQTTN